VNDGVGVGVKLVQIYSNEIATPEQSGVGLGVKNGVNVGVTVGVCDNPGVGVAVGVGVWVIGIQSPSCEQDEYSVIYWLVNN
jgi:hypothetical protein